MNEPKRLITIGVTKTQVFTYQAELTKSQIDEFLYADIDNATIMAAEGLPDGQVAESTTWSNPCVINLVEVDD